MLPASLVYKSTLSAMDARNTTGSRQTFLADVQAA
jgi:hypothetical protein